MFSREPDESNQNKRAPFILTSLVRIVKANWIGYVRSLVNGKPSRNSFGTEADGPILVCTGSEFLPTHLDFAFPEMWAVATELFTCTYNAIFENCFHFQ